MKETTKYIGLIALATLALLSSATYANPDLNKEDLAFFRSIQQLVQENNYQDLAEILSYPFVLRVESEAYNIESEKQFIDHAKLLEQSNLRQAVLNQSLNSLFKNWQGVMVGNGELWFSEVLEGSEGQGTWNYRITALNLKTLKGG